MTETAINSAPPDKRPPGLAGWPFSLAALAVFAAAQTWAFALVISVVADLDWVRTRAAGGQFETFTVGLRVAYLVNVALIGATSILGWRLWKQRGATTRKQFIWARIASAVFALSTIVNAASQSPDERWNAIGSAIVAVALFVWSRRTSPAS
jgi:hypothetical protein